MRLSPFERTIAFGMILLGYQGRSERDFFRCGDGQGFMGQTDFASSVLEVEKPDLMVLAPLSRMRTGLSIFLVGARMRVS